MIYALHLIRAVKKKAWQNPLNGVCRTFAGRTWECLHRPFQRIFITRGRKIKSLTQFLTQNQTFNPLFLIKNNKKITDFQRKTVKNPLSWRRERDLNPCIHSCITRFRIVRVRPLRHLCNSFYIIYHSYEKCNYF